jgi:glucose/arabinose dehydrogenase
VRLRLANGRVVREERYLAELRARIRDVREGPDGAIYLLTDDSPNGRLLRVTPGSR